MFFHSISFYKAHLTFPFVDFQPELAAPLYLRARKWISASQCYEHIDNFARAVKVLDEQELYDQAIDCLQRYKFRRQVRGNERTKGLIFE